MRQQLWTRYFGNAPSFLRWMRWKNKNVTLRVSYYKYNYICSFKHPRQKQTPGACSAWLFTSKKIIFKFLFLKNDGVSYYTRLFDPDPLVLERRATYHSKALDLLFLLKKNCPLEVTILSARGHFNEKSRFSPEILGVLKNQHRHTYQMRKWLLAPILPELALKIFFIW